MDTTPRLTSFSKFLSLVLRHEPQRIGIELDEAGWTAVDALLQQCALAGKKFSHDELAAVVASSDKQRFAFSDDGLRIRANQGHSVAVDLDLPAVVPPDVLFHGTASRFVEAILREGLLRRARHHVHLTQSRDIAMSVGQRHGSPVILRIDAQAMAAQGHAFKCSANGVWLADDVPAVFIQREP